MVHETDISRASVRIRDGHDNFFTPLRLIFALLVMVGHTSIIALRNTDAEPQVLFQYTFSYLAVNLFFIASGFLVTGSMLFRGDKASFASARLLRIYPALIIHVLIVMLVVGPMATSLPLATYLTDLGLWMEPFKVLTFINTDMILPGVFEDNHEAYASVPLWTLRYELLCYIATILAFSLGLMKHRWMVLAQFIVPSLVWIAGQTFGIFETLPATAENMVRFGIAYGLGATIFAYRDRVSIHWLAAPVALALCYMLRHTVSLEIAVNLFLGTVVFLVAYVRVPKLNVLKKLDDVSYGIYIYHWVVLQLFFSWMPGLSTTSLFLMALPVVVLISWLSWVYIEKPMLAHKNSFAEWLRFGRPKATFDRKTVLLD